MGSHGSRSTPQDTGCSGRVPGGGISMGRAENKQVLCEFLDTICAEDMTSADLDENLPFEQTGLIDSFAILEIVTFLEERFSIDFSSIGIDPENLGSIGRILNLIEHSASR